MTYPAGDFIREELEARGWMQTELAELIGKEVTPEIAAALGAAFGTSAEYWLNLATPGIQQTPGVCGGDPCIRRTRIPVWSLVRGRQLGMTEAELLDDYPGLTAQDLANAWAYAEAHRDDIERQILENERA